MPSRGRIWIKSAIAKHDVVANRECPRLDRGSSSVGRRTLVNSHISEVTTELRLHVRADRSIERTTNTEPIEQPRGRGACSWAACCAALACALYARRRVRTDRRGRETVGFELRTIARLAHGKRGRYGGRPCGTAHTEPVVPRGTAGGCGTCWTDRRRRDLASRNGYATLSTTRCHEP